MTHDDGHAMDINSHQNCASNVLPFPHATVPCMAWLLDCVSLLHRIYSIYVMGHTGTHGLILFLGAVINSAKPDTFDQVHVYVHELSHCFKYLCNRCMGAFRNCHSVDLCKCARETVHSLTEQKIATLYKRTKTVPDWLHGRCMIVAWLHRHARCMVLQNRRLHPPA